MLACRAGTGSGYPGEDALPVVVCNVWPHVGQEYNFLAGLVETQARSAFPKSPKYLQRQTRVIVYFNYLWCLDWNTDFNFAWGISIIYYLVGEKGYYFTDWSRLWKNFKDSAQRSYYLQNCFISIDDRLLTGRRMNFLIRWWFFWVSLWRIDFNQLLVNQLARGFSFYSCSVHSINVSLMTLVLINCMNKYF